MADKFTKVVVDSPAAPEAPADAWKDTQVEKEHQPAKVKSRQTYRQMEQQVAAIDAQVVSLGEQKSALEAEMVKVKAAAES
tara:strand:+ start:181 stop:423 length:243 start_codon:yes stop_codon:yes gene_type:complete